MVLGALVYEFDSLGLNFIFVSSYVIWSSFSILSLSESGINKNSCYYIKL